MRWLVTMAATGVAFVTALWLAWTFSISFEPRAGSDRWAVAGGFAVAMSAAVLTAVGWWAGREKAPRARVPHARQPVPDRSLTGSHLASSEQDSSPAPAGDHVDFRGSTFNGPVTGKGEIYIDESRPSP
jgi:hypothetical protein